MNNNLLIDWKENQSKAIDLLRFPLAIFVIFVHMNPITCNPFTSDFSFFSAKGLYNILGLILSKGIGHIAVPIFFVISGYLFFANFKEWSWDGYKKKMKSRAKTLLVPYIIWNIACLLLLVAIKIAGIYLKGHTWEEVGDFFYNYWFHFLFDVNHWGDTNYAWVPWTYYNSGPIDLPLWFLRDLIIVTALTPIIYWFVNKTKIYGTTILGLVYIFKLLPPIPGLGATSVFFFTLGAYLSINNYNLSELFTKVIKITLPLAIVSFVIRLYFIGNAECHVIAHSIFIISATLSSFGIASILIAKKNIVPNKLLISSCFFVYAFHAIPGKSPLGCVRKVLGYILPGSITYLLAPIATAFLLVLIYQLLKRFFPKVAGLLSGNR